MVRVTTGVEAHTHEYISTAHEDQKFGFSIAGGSAAEALRAVPPRPGLDLVGVHSHIGSQIFDAEGFDVAARRTLRLHADFAAEHGVELPELDLGGGFGIAYTSQDTPATPDDLAAAMRPIVETECAALGSSVPHLSIEPGRSISGPSGFALYTVGTVKRVHLDGGCEPALRRRRRRHERQHPYGALRRGVLRHARLPPLRRRRPSPGSWASTARAATSSSATSSCPPTSPPAT